MKNLLIILFFLFSVLSNGQTTIINEPFSATSPSGWNSTSNTWILNYNATSTSNYQSAYYSARFPSASNGNSIWLYIPLNFNIGFTYQLSFYTKRACTLTINVNENPNQITLLSSNTYTNPNCSSNWNTWYNWNSSYTSTYTGSGYFQINVSSVYGGPTSVYLDDVNLTENSESLPIELLYLEGKFENGTNKLYWATSSEKNNDFFTIEKSYNGLDFYILGCLLGSGNSTELIKYEYIDFENSSEISYYRIKQTDYDGKFEYSPIVSINKKIKEKILIKTIDITGKETTSDEGIIIYIYEDGSFIKLKK